MLTSDAQSKRNRFKKHSPMLSKMNYNKIKSPKADNSEVEKQLDFSVLPKQTIQEKIGK